MQKNMIVVIAVVAVLLGAGAAVLVFGGNHSNSNSYGAIDSKLQIRGNANNDYTIDSDDMKVLEDVISGDKSKEDYPFADVNADGDVNETDKTLLQKLIDREAGTDVYVSCFDIEKKSCNTKVKYPLDFVVPVGTDMMTIMWAGGQEKVAGYFWNAYKGMQNTPFAVQLGSSPAINDASWKQFQTLDANLKEQQKGGVGAIILNTQYASTLAPRSDDISKAAIPVIGYPSADAETEIATILTLGFLFGKATEDKSLEYAELGWNVVKDVKDKVKDMKEEDKKTFIAFCMTSYICQNDSTLNGSALSAGGIHYSKVDSAYAAKYAGTSVSPMGSTEALANYSADVMTNFTTQDSVKDSSERASKMIQIWESAKSYYQAHPSYQRTVYVNLTLPDACRIAYCAHALYPELFSLDWANEVMQKYIDAGFEPLKGKTIEDNLITMVTYTDYQNAKA